jgi:hypothetical protein
MLRLPHVRVIVTTVALAMPSAILPAQNPSRRPDCNLAEKRFDNPFADHSGWSMRRYEWHAFYAAASTAAAEGIHRATHLPRWASAVTVTVALGIVPHLRSGVFAKRYPINPPDWGFDLFNRAAPLFVWSGLRGGSTRSELFSATSYAAGYIVLACYASP